MEELGKKRFVCPECGGELKCMCVIGGGQSGSGQEERLYHCEKCLRDWQRRGTNDELERKFWG